MEDLLRSCHVLVTPTSFGRNDPGIKTELEKRVEEVQYNPESRPLTSSELVPLVSNIDGWIAGLDEIDSAVISAAPKLKVIARYGVGVDRVDVDAATKRGVVVTNTPGANSTAVAELTIGLMLALCRNICRANRDVHLGGWPRFSGVGLRGKTVGIVGFGAIGREVALKLRAFQCRVLASDPYIKAETAKGTGAELTSLDELLSISDLVSLHTSATSQTSRMVDAAFLKKMKRDAFLVNTARGELIDEEALRRSLENNELRGAALDCFQKEPPGADHPLLRLPQVIATPHMGAHTDEAINKMGRMSMEACLAVLRGERPTHIVNPEIYEQ